MEHDARKRRFSHKMDKRALERTIFSRGKRLVSIEIEIELEAFLSFWGSRFYGMFNFGNRDKIFVGHPTCETSQLI